MSWPDFGWRFGISLALPVQTHQEVTRSIGAGAPQSIRIVELLYAHIPLKIKHSARGAIMSVLRIRGRIDVSAIYFRVVDYGGNLPTQARPYYGQT